MGDIALTFLAGYRQQLIYALLLWPLASLAVTMPVLAILYHRDGRVRLRSFAGAYLVVLYLLALVCFTQLPLPSGTSGPGITYGRTPQFDPLNFVDDIRSGSATAIAQIVYNVVFFVPLGYVAHRFWRRGLLGATAIGFAVSLLLEVAQLTGLFGIYPYSYRIFDVDDIACNTLGCAIGWLCGGFAGIVAPVERGRVTQLCTSPGLMRRAVALSVDLLVMVASCAALTFAAVAVLRPTRAASWVATASSAADLSGDSWLLSWAGVRHVLATGWGFVSSALASPGLSRVILASACLALIVFECLVPLARGGRTIGGGYVHMTFETRPRRGALRAAFYLARLATLAALAALPLGTGVVLVAFWLVTRRMPYDFVPAARDARPAPAPFARRDGAGVSGPAVS